jgi:hypothetical protein
MKKMFIGMLSVIVVLSLGACKDESMMPTTDATPNDKKDNTPSVTSTTTPSNTPATTDQNLSVKDFVPFEKDVYMKYAGTGNEYAPFERYVDYVTKDRIQMRQITGGTTMINVFEWKEGVLKKVYAQGEVYYKYDYTNAPSNTNEVVLKEPIKEGEMWELTDGATRKITSLNKKVSTPLGDYTALEVTTTRSESTVKEYYAKGIGLIKTEFSTKNGDVVTSEVEKMEKNKPLKETIRFYYPQFMKDTLRYIDRNIETNTNEDMALLFTEQFKTIPENSDLTRVLSQGTIIRSIFINHENETVSVDFSKDLVTDMKTGAGLEGMLLKSLANTFGRYYQKEKVILTVEGKPYESGHFLMKPGEAFETDFEGIEEFKK